MDLAGKLEAESEGILWNPEEKRRQRERGEQQRQNCHFPLAVLLLVLILVTAAPANTADVIELEEAYISDIRRVEMVQVADFLSLLAVAPRD